MYIETGQKGYKILGHKGLKVIGQVTGREGMYGHLGIIYDRSHGPRDNRMLRSRGFWSNLIEHSCNAHPRIQGYNLFVGGRLGWINEWMDGGWMNQ